MNKEQLRQHREREVEAYELKPGRKKRDNVKARVVRIVQKRGNEAHRGAHNSRGRADNGGLEQSGVCLAGIENSARQLKRHGASHKDLQRERKDKLHQDDRPDRHKPPEHINAALAVYRAEHAVGVVHRHKRLPVYNVKAEKYVSVYGNNYRKKCESDSLKSILRHKTTP